MNFIKSIFVIFNQGKIQSMKNYANVLTSDRHEIVNILNKSFQSVFVKEHGEIPEFVPRITKPFEWDWKNVVTNEAVQQKLYSLDVRKTCGSDGISPYVLKNCSSSVATPLALIYRKSIETGNISSKWKEANTTPIFKNGNTTDPLNRPVSLTSLPCKVMEAFIKEAIMTHLMENKLLSKNQHGFVKNKACVTNLLETLDILTASMSDSLAVDMIYMDFAKFFDKVPHKRLLKKCEAYGIKGVINDWISSNNKGCNK
ncbi:uncharacterized protein LOC124818843 [Hydra vulgaris]|uniref:uncharacterized protein LOC124818843 n=1 Tax=Hydra vulgaris TaxID=6087 RepID=UPI001F5F5E9C|nr:uncharacterized protein LOC124818843 [Hydra vulgaris]